MEIFTREAAHLAGKQRYYTGVPCRKGHLTERYVSTGACLTCLNPFKLGAPRGQKHVSFNVLVPDWFTPEHMRALQLAAPPWTVSVIDGWRAAQLAGQSQGNGAAD
jgi:hypothetical protein